jgi:hypothetical protein
MSCPAIIRCAARKCPGIAAYVRDSSGAAPDKKPEPDHSGIWLADDDGWYFIRQFDAVLWGVGVSCGELCPGRRFCNVYHASVTGPAITGDWSDVPRGATSGRGSLTLRFAEGAPQKVSDTGGFSASTWRRQPPPSFRLLFRSPWPVISVAEAFQRTLKNAVGNWDINEKQTVAENLKTLKDLERAAEQGIRMSGTGRSSHSHITVVPLSCSEKK